LTKYFSLLRHKKENFSQLIFMKRIKIRETVRTRDEKESFLSENIATGTKNYKSKTDERSFL